LRLHVEVQTDEEILDDGDEHIGEDTANYKIRDQEYDTEEELPDNENEVDAGPLYLGKHGNTKWLKITPPKNFRTRT
jgi:hypothetical protein